MPTDEFVILVDDQDQEIGLMEKYEAHRKGLLHRAFSVFVFNDNKELLLQKRAFHKYHSPGLWTNTCCSHPRKNESILDASYRRLEEEMGMLTPLKWVDTLLYRAQLDQEMIEHELDHILIGFSNDEPKINPEEVDSYAYFSILKLKEMISFEPERFTEWFKLIVPKLEGYIKDVS